MKKTVWNAVRLYFHYVSIHIKSAMQYKESFCLSILGQFMVSFNLLLGIWFMFQRFQKVKGFTFQEVILSFSIMLLGFTLAEVIFRGFDSFSGMIRKGEFDRVLVRPRNNMFQVLASKIELTRIGRLAQAVVMFVYAVTQGDIMWDYKKVLTVILMLLGGIGLFAGIFIIYASFCFFTVQNLEFMNILIDGAREYGKYPIGIYGRTMLRICTYAVPYALVQYYPFLYLIGRKDSFLYMLLPLLSFWFLIPCIMFWKYGVRRYQSTGS